MKQNEITLCLIVKNEEKYIESCLKSVAPLTDKILIADTGSTDNTISICKRYTDHIEQIDFSSGFSIARNHLLKQVKTPWVLFLDADEYFDGSELNRLEKILDEVSPDVEALSLLRYNFFPSGAFYTSETIKLFRSDPDIVYSGIVVDSVKPSLLKRGGKILQTPVILNHFGHCRPIQVRNKKAETYLAMIDEELKQNPKNFKAIGYKALILRTIGKLDESRIWGEKALSLAPEVGHPYFVKGHIHRAFNEHEEAIVAYTRAIELDGMNPVYLNSRGVALLTNGSYIEATYDFELGQKLYPHHIHFTINLGLVDQALGNYEMATKRFTEIGTKYPAFLKTDFQGCLEIDPYSGYIFDTPFNFHGLSYHLSYCKSKLLGLI